MTRPFGSSQRTATEPFSRSMSGTTARTDTAMAASEAICDQVPVTRLHDAMIESLLRRVWKKPVIDLRPSAAPRATQEALL